VKIPSCIFCVSCHVRPGMHATCVLRLRGCCMGTMGAMFNVNAMGAAWVLQVHPSLYIMLHGSYDRCGCCWAAVAAFVHVHSYDCCECCYR
jgi:hypothetical protein